MLDKKKKRWPVRKKKVNPQSVCVRKFSAVQAPGTKKVLTLLQAALPLQLRSCEKIDSFRA